MSLSTAGEEQSEDWELWNLGSGLLLLECRCAYLAMVFAAISVEEVRGWKRETRLQYSLTGTQTPLQ